MIDPNPLPVLSDQDFLAGGATATQMADYQQIPLDHIFPPQNAMRQESFSEGIDELCESMERFGLLEPIGLKRLADGFYEVVYGMRRTFAAKRLGWLTINARILEGDENELSLVMAHENFHRTELSPLEEAAYYRRYMDAHQISINEMARRARKSYQRVSELLRIAAGDPAVAEALRAGTISRAQAAAVNAVEDEIGRGQALHFAAHDGLAAKFIEAWAQQRRLSGVSSALATTADQIRALPQVDMRQQNRCWLHDGWVDIQQGTIYWMCDDCKDLILTAVTEYASARREIKDEAMQHAPDSGGVGHREDDSPC